MSDVYSVLALSISIASGCFVFLNKIKRIRCSQENGVEIIRDVNNTNEIERTQLYTMELLKFLHQRDDNIRKKSIPAFPPLPIRRCHSDDACLKDSARSPYSRNSVNFLEADLQSTSKTLSSMIMAKNKKTKKPKREEMLR